MADGSSSSAGSRGGCSMFNSPTNSGRGKYSCRNKFYTASVKVLGLKAFLAQKLNCHRKSSSMHDCSVSQFCGKVLLDTLYDLHCTTLVARNPQPPNRNIVGNVMVTKSSSNLDRPY